jgi:hypothetical protein
MIKSNENNLSKTSAISSNMESKALNIDFNGFSPSVINDLPKVKYIIAYILKGDNLEIFIKQSIAQFFATEWYQNTLLM